MAGEKPRHNRTDDKPEHDEQNAEFERFEDLTKKLLKVPKEKVDEQRREYEQTRRKEHKQEKREREREREKKRA